MANEKGKGEEDTSVGIHPLVKVFALGEEVCYSIGMSRDVVKVVVEILEEFHPSGLATHDFLRLAEVL